MGRCQVVGGVSCLRVCMYSKMGRSVKCFKICGSDRSVKWFLFGCPRRFSLMLFYSKLAFVCVR